MSLVETDRSSTPRAAARGSGLDAVVVADTEISEVDGAAGRLILRGYALQVLAGKVSFEEMLWLLWEGKLPSSTQLLGLKQDLAASRRKLIGRLSEFERALSKADGMDALRACVTLLDLDHDEQTARLELCAALPVFLAAFAQRRATGADSAHWGNTCESTAELLLRGVSQLRGLDGEAHPRYVRGLDTYLVTVAEHGMNASTFAARVVASTGSDTGSAVVAALGALKGPLHGGAPGPVLDLLDRIGSPEHIGACLRQELAAGRRIMGMGHRVYRVRDPRAEVLEQATRALGSGPHQARIALSRQVEQEAVRLLEERHPGRALCANVEFYTAILLEALGIPRDLFTSVFACGRVAGYLAHIAEQRRSARIMRPSSRYVGPVFQAV